MINLSLREAIVKRVQDKDEEELLEIIEGSMHGDEHALPGLESYLRSSGITWTHPFAIN